MPLVGMTTNKRNNYLYTQRVKHHLKAQTSG